MSDLLLFFLLALQRHHKLLLFGQLLSLDPKLFLDPVNLNLLELFVLLKRSLDHLEIRMTNRVESFQVVFGFLYVVPGLSLFEEAEVGQNDGRGS